MYYDLVLPLPGLMQLEPRRTVIILTLAVDVCESWFSYEVFSGMLFGRSLSRMYYTGDFRAQGLRLPPSTIGQRRIVRCRGSEMPLLVSCVQPGSMSVASSAVLLFKYRLSRVYLAMITTAGGCPITYVSLPQCLSCGECCYPVCMD